MICKQEELQIYLTLNNCTHLQGFKYSVRNNNNNNNNYKIVDFAVPGGPQNKSEESEKKG